MKDHLKVNCISISELEVLKWIKHRIRFVEETDVLDMKSKLDLSRMIFENVTCISCESTEDVTGEITIQVDDENPAKRGCEFSSCVPGNSAADLRERASRLRDEGSVELARRPQDSGSPLVSILDVAALLMRPPHSAIRADSVPQEEHSLPCPLSVLIPILSLYAFLIFKDETR